MEEFLVSEGPYAGRICKSFSSVSELISYFDTPVLQDGDVVGIPQGEVPDWIDGKDYGIGIASTEGQLGIAFGYRTTYEVFSMHDLPDPGWVVDLEKGTVTSPDGTIYGWWFPVIIGLVLLLVVVAVALLVMASYRAIFAAQVAQLSETVAVVNSPTGETVTLNKETGEILNISAAPFDWKWLIIIPVVIGGVVILSELFLKGRSLALEAIMGRPERESLPSKPWWETGEAEKEPKRRTRAERIGRGIRKTAIRVGRGVKGIYRGVRGES